MLSRKLRKEKEEHRTISTRHITSPSPQKEKKSAKQGVFLPQISVRSDQGIVHLRHIGIGGQSDTTEVSRSAFVSDNLRPGCCSPLFFKAMKAPIFLMTISGLEIPFIFIMPLESLRAWRWLLTRLIYNCSDSSAVGSGLHLKVEGRAVKVTT